MNGSWWRTQSKWSFQMFKNKTSSFCVPFILHPRSWGLPNVLAVDADVYSIEVYFYPTVESSSSIDTCLQVGWDEFSFLFFCNRIKRNYANMWSGPECARIKKNSIEPIAILIEANWRPLSVFLCGSNDGHQIESRDVNGTTTQFLIGNSPGKGHFATHLDFLPTFL